jgi:hypothetical protein
MYVGYTNSCSVSFLVLLNSNVCRLSIIHTQCLNILTCADMNILTCADMRIGMTTNSLFMDEGT